MIGLESVGIIILVIGFLCLMFMLGYIAGYHDGKNDDSDD